MTDRRNALVLEIKNTNSPYLEALLQVDGCEKSLWIDVIPTVKVGAYVYVSEDSVLKSIYEKRYGE